MYIDPSFSRSNRPSAARRSGGELAIPTTINYGDN
jgi:hypothetical protein